MAGDTYWTVTGQGNFILIGLAPNVRRPSIVNHPAQAALLLSAIQARSLMPVNWDRNGGPVIATGSLDLRRPEAGVAPYALDWCRARRKAAIALERPPLRAAHCPERGSHPQG